VKQKPPTLVSIDSIQELAMRAWTLNCASHSLDHDMRNIVQALRSGVNLLAKSGSRESNTRTTQPDCVELLRKQISALETFWGKVIAEVTMSPESPIVVDPLPMLTDALRALSDEKAVAGVLVENPQDYRMQAAPLLLRRLLEALLQIAADAVSEAGTIAITLTETSAAKGPVVAIEVNVVGYPDAGQVGDTTFARIDAWTSVLNRMGGAENISVTATPLADGISLRLTAPRSNTRPVANEGLQQALPTVLVVDRIRDAADSLGMLLELEGCSARQAYSGGQALDLLHAGGFDAVVVNPALGDMTADEFVTRVRKRSDTLILVALAENPAARNALASNGKHGFDMVIGNSAEIASVRSALASRERLR
jgi:CheY-like chemotaxis protein